MTEVVKTRPRMLVVLTVVAAPLAFGLETLLRKLLFPPDFDQVRDFLRGPLTPFAWALAVVALLATLVALAVYDRAARRAVERIPHERRTADVSVRAATGVFLLTSSIPQLPAVASTMLFTFGAPLVPTVVAIGIASLGVVLQAIRLGMR